MLVRFAALCDQCGRRSAEYTTWPGCRSCGADICPGCQAPDEAGTEIDGRWVGVQCRRCAKGGEGDDA